MKAIVNEDGKISFSITNGWSFGDASIGTASVTGTPPEGTTPSANVLTLSYSYINSVKANGKKTLTSISASGTLVYVIPGTVPQTITTIVSLTINGSSTKSAGDTNPFVLDGDSSSGGSGGSISISNPGQSDVQTE